MNTLADYGITQIVAIDDGFSIDLKTKLEDLLETDRERMTDLDDFYHASSEGATISDFFIEENYNEEEKEDFWNDYFEIDYYNKIKSEDSINFITCHPKKNKKEENITSLYSNSSNDKIFIILDKVLDQNPSLSKSMLRDQLELINSIMLKNHNLFLVLFSSDPEEFSNYNKVLDYLTKTLQVNPICAKNLALHINFIDKKNYEIADFISALRKSQKANFVNSFDNVFELSISSLKDRIWDINHNESLLHYDYLVEGQHIDTIIYEMFKSKFKYSYNEYRYENYDKLINPVRNSIQKYEQFRINNDQLEVDSAPDKYRFLKSVNHAVYSKNTELKVSQSDDIAYGDIIEINDKMYLVISQNCDITIRSNGTRKLKNFNLVEIEEQTQIIDIDWLKKEFTTYCKSCSIKFTEEGLKIFKNMFFMENEQTELEIMGFEKSNLKKIEDVTKYFDKTKYNKVKFEEKKELSKKREYSIKSKELISIPCFWLDVLLLRKTSDKTTFVTPATDDTVITTATDNTVITPATDDTVITPATDDTIIAPATDDTIIAPATDDTVITTATDDTIIAPATDDTVITPVNTIVTIETIENSKEIRLATKKFIKTELTNLLKKLEGIQKDAVDLSLDNNLFNPVIPVKAIWEENLLKGFEVVNVNRNIHLDEAKTRELHKQVIDSQVREAINIELLI